MTPLEVAPRIAAIADSDERYHVTSPLEIGQILRGLLAQRALISAHAGRHGAFFLTALLEVDDEDGTLVCDYGVDAALTERLLEEPLLTFVTQLDHVRIQFSASGATVENYEGGRAFRVAVPDVVMRLQRREHYRLKIPRGRPLYCEIKLPADAQKVTSAQQITLPVHDISCGGVALTGWPENFGPRPGLQLPDASIELPALGRLVANLWVVLVESSGGRGPNTGRFGCRFVGANPGVAMLVQRYINRVEREQRALL